MVDKKPYLSERNPPRLLDVFLGDDIKHVFADGAARIMLGPEITKIELTRSLGTKTEPDFGEVDQRETFCFLTMPTSAVAELCATLLEQYGKNTKQLASGSQISASVIREALKRVTAIKL
jgi:hypothetical protein